MPRTTVFRNNRTQAVRLPKALAFPEEVQVVDVRIVGKARILTPVGSDWSYWAEHGTAATDDFCVARDQPMPQERRWQV